MVEVTCQNFSEKLKEFEHAVQKCLFFSIDCEYSSLPYDFTSANTLFDTGEDRYLKLKDILRSSLIIQVGITTFRHYRDLNHYEAYPFSFYVFPKAFGHFNHSMVFKANTIEFLCHSKFNFNKVFYDGITYMNKTERENVSKCFQDGTLLNYVENNLNYEERDEIIKICEGISKWSSSASVGDITEVVCNPHQLDYNYVLKEEICAMNQDLLASTDNSKILIKKVKREQKSLLEKNRLNDHETLINSLMGFSKIIEILAASKKPLVGHNLLLDLLTIYQQFYDNLPGSYNAFKTNLNALFPIVFDTKHIAYELINLKAKGGSSRDFPKTSLSSIFESYQDKDNCFYNPLIKMEPKGIYEKVEEQQPHDAGWDSYMTGFIFLKMADEAARNRRMQKYSMNVTSLELMASVSAWENLLCIAHSKIYHVNLAGKDPTSKRPPLIYISRVGKKSLGVIELDAILKKYEPLHKKPINMYSALIATPNYTCYKKILVDFSNSNEFKVEKYSLLRHHRGIRACLIAGVLVPAVMTVWFGLKPR